MFNPDQVLVRFSKPEDMESVLGLIKELAVYEHAGSEVTNTAEQLIEDGFGDNPAFECLVALVNEKIAGFAIFFTSYSTWKGKCLYLEDICVKEEFRRKGVGKKLFDHLIDLAKERKMKRLSWQVLEWNQPAISFYKKYNALLDAEWINCKLIISG